MSSSKIRFMVDGMHCPNCVKKIKGALEEMQGVDEALVDREAGLVDVTYQTEQSRPEDIQEIINTIHGGKFFAARVGQL
ncbi:MAG: Heavy-metal-associated domain [Paenibacillaceae bacterium]|jgi:copper chaperone|nr:Heavy-metal-associated domain [Paenibacillaceae bacterium]